jgi:hypothetical protein
MAERVVVYCASNVVVLEAQSLGSQGIDAGAGRQAFVAADAPEPTLSTRMDGSA